MFIQISGNAIVFMIELLDSFFVNNY